MTERSFDDYLQAANAPLDDPSGNVQVGRGRPRFEAYHFRLPVCLQKVRACIAEKQATDISHDINIQPGNCHPDHIRLQMPGGKGRRLVRGYTGRFSMATEGFDPTVVPTLVGLEEQRVYVDTVKTCAHVDRVCDTGTDLLPDSLLPCIWAEIAIVDGTPHVAMLYGAHPDGDFQPEMRRGGMQGVHDRKTEKLENTGTGCRRPRSDRGAGCE